VEGDEIPFLASLFTSSFLNSGSALCWRLFLSQEFTFRMDVLTSGSSMFAREDSDLFSDLLLDVDLMLGSAVIVSDLHI